MKSVPAVVAAAVGAAVAVVSLIGPTTFFVVDSAFVGSRWGDFFDSAAATSSVAVLVALVVAVSLRRRVTAIIGAAVGLIALAVFAFTVTTGRGVGYPTAIAAGLVLGALAVATHPGTPSSGGAGRIGLAAGVVAGFLLAQSIPASSFRRFEGNRRSADYVPGGSVWNAASPSIPIVVGAVVALIALAAFAFAVRGTTPAVVGRPDAVVIITGVGIPVVVVLVAAWLHESRSSVGALSPPGWVFGAIVVVIVLAVAFFLPGRTGLASVGVVILVATGAATEVSDVEPVIVVVVAVLIGLGAAAARWRNLLPVAITTLVVVVLLQLADGESSVLIAAVSGLFVAPFAASYAVAACVSEPSPSPTLSHPAIIASALSACVPLSTFSGVADFGWTAYTPLTDAPDGFDRFGVGFTSGNTVTVSVLSLVAAGVVAAIVTRRSA